MTCTDFAFPVRSGEHACCRSDDARDRERLLVAFVRAGLARGHKVVDLCDQCELRGQEDEPLTISAASSAVRRLVGLLGWDTDPSVRVIA
jgi:hypothetical protein